MGFAKPDARGKNTIPKHKLTDEARRKVLEHFESFPKVESHYVRKRSKKIYIEDTTNFSKLTVAKMHSLYEIKCKEDGTRSVCLSTFEKKFKSENLKIHKPKKDQCNICTKYDRMNPEERVTGKEDQQLHITNKDKVMKLKEEFKLKGKEDKNILTFNFDLEAVLYTPCDKVSTIFYVRKLCTYNCTMFDLVSREGYCYMWNETTGKRGSNEIATCLYRYLCESEAKNVILFSDTCGGQNQNQYVATMLMHVAENHETIETLDHIFMVQGHSHMEVDNMHSAIERKSGGLQIYEPYGWEVVACIARKNPYVVKTLENIVDVKRLQEDMQLKNVTVNTENEKVRWKDDKSITWLRYEKDQPNTILYKCSYDKEDDFMKIKCITGRTSKRKKSHACATGEGYTMPMAYTGNLPVSKAKKKDLMQLCKDLVIPARYHSFYENILTMEDRDIELGDNSTDSELDELDELDEDTDNE